MDTARPTNRPSIDRCVPQALAYRSASLLRNLSACGVLDDAQQQPTEGDLELAQRSVSYKLELKLTFYMVLHWVYIRVCRWPHPPVIYIQMW